MLNAGWCGKNAEYVVYSSGLLKLGGTGATYQYKNHGNRPFIDYLEMINKIYVGKGITVLNLNIFSYLLAKEVVFEEDGVLFNISTGAFHSMPYLRELNIPEGVTSIGAIAFKRSTGLQRINIPASVKSISDTAFKDCSKALVLYVAEGSYAENFAKTTGLNYTNESFVRNGFIEECGEIYYYENGVLWTRRGVFQVGDSFYYAKNGGALVKNQTIWATVTNDLVPFAKYDFDENGKMNVKHGFVEENGELYYYTNGVKLTQRGLFKVGSDYYYAKSGGALLRNCTEWANVTNDLLPKARYDFDGTGKIILKNGFVEENGELYYYEDGTKRIERGLFKVGNDYYYSMNGGALLRNCTEWANVTNDLLPKARYNFDENGKIVLKNGFIEEDGELYYYIDGVKWSQRGAFKVGNDCYYAQNGGALLRNQTLWVSVTNGLITEGRHTFDENGKIVL